METLVFEDSPLGSYLEGRGEAEAEAVAQTQTRESNDDVKSFPYAPSINIKHQKRMAQNLVQPIIKGSTVNGIRQICAAFVNTTLDNKNNEHFLEHFRYQIIASQLLSDSAGSVIAPTQPTEHSPLRSPLPDVAATTTGACVAATSAFIFVWIVHWVRHDGSAKQWGWRSAFTVCLTLTLTICIWGYARRSSILHLRRSVIDATSTLTTNLQSLNSTSHSLLSLIQEVELVSRGYRISHPLPPISRIEGSNQPRKAIRLRKTLQAGYEHLLPALVSAVEKIRPLVDQYDVERLLDVYEVGTEDIQDALQAPANEQQGDEESLSQLQNQQNRYGTLRRLLLCSLLSLQATDRRVDAQKWQLTTSMMEIVAKAAGDFAEQLIKLLNDEEQSSNPTTPLTPVMGRRRTISGKEQICYKSRVESQVRRISTLSSGIRSLQAKLYLLREESTRALSSSSSEHELSDVTNSLREQYEGLGADLGDLMEAWQAGKHALARDISKQERRMSQPNSPEPGRSSHHPVLSSDGHLATVLEGGDTFAGLHGNSNMPLSPPATEDGSEDHSADDEVFEALSSPRVRERSTLSREERIAKVQEERDRLAMAKEKRDANVNMVKELQSVIKLRPVMRTRKPDPYGRTSSL